MKAAQITRIRKRLDMSQGEFAKAIGASRQTVCRWESNDYQAGRILPVYERQIRELAKRKGGRK